MPPGKPGESEGFPEEVLGPVLVPKDRRSQPGKKESQEEGKHVQGSWGLECDMLREW